MVRDCTKADRKALGLAGNGWLAVLGWMLLGGLMPGTAHGQTVMEPDIDPGSGVEMKLESWLGSCPPTGMVALKWKVTNHAASRRKWDLWLTSGYEYGAGGMMKSRYSMTVEGGQRGEMMLYVPLVACTDKGGDYNQINWTAAGPGVRGGGVLGSAGGGSSGRKTGFVVMSRSVSNRGYWEDLRNRLEKKNVKNAAGKGVDLRGLEADMKLAPDDWRGYSGLAQLWMTEAEWLGLGEARRAAVLDWVRFGGQVMVAVADESPERLAGLKIPEAVSGVRRHGAGRVRLLVWDGKKAPLEQAEALVMESVGGNAQELLGGYDSSWNLSKETGELALNPWLIFGFIAGFGLVVGPFNLFWLAKDGRRHRLFWTTPLISVAGSLLLAGLMLMQDGVGGDGIRQMLLLLAPEQKKVSVLQEQISKTGVLLGKSYPKKEPSWLQPLNLADGRTHRYNQRGDLFVETAEARSGEWFASRAIQAQMAKAVRPSRAGVELFPQAEPGGAPEVLSSVDAVLDTVFVMDKEGRVWKAENLGTGERKRMMASSLEALRQWFKVRALNEAGPVMGEVLEKVKELPGHVYASADSLKGQAVESLESIRWNKEKLLVTGPYVEGR